MGKLFGAKWEKQNGVIGGSMFYEWADIIEPMQSEVIRVKFTELEKRFKQDVQAGKDIWPPTMAYFLALECKKRVNEAMYKEFQYALPEHTRAEYKEMGDRGMEKVRENIRD